MELLWDDMRARVNDASTPKEHQDMLDSRRLRVDNGESALLDWDQVKNTIGRA